MGVATPKILGDHGGLHEILLGPIHPIMFRNEIKTLSKVVTFQKYTDLCIILNTNSGHDTLKPVLHASVC